MCVFQHISCIFHIYTHTLTHPHTHTYAHPTPASPYPPTHTYTHPTPASPPHTHTHTVIFLAIGIGVFVGIDQDYAGFFSLEGEPTDGCLSWGFGIALAAFIINIIATIVGVVAIFYRQIRRYQKAKFQY